MEREPLALADTIESLRNEVESMWNDIRVSFDKIDREIDQTIKRYKSSSVFDEREESDEYIINRSNPNLIQQPLSSRDRHHNKKDKDYQLKPIQMMSINSGASSLSSASASSHSHPHSTPVSMNNPYQSPNRYHHNNYHHRTLSPIQQDLNNNMQRSPAPPRSSKYATPVHSHIMSSPYFHIKNRFPNYDSNYSEYTDDGTPNIAKDTPTIDIRLSLHSKQLRNDLPDFNRNDTLSPEAMGTPSLHLQKSNRNVIELSNPNDSPINNDDIDNHEHDPFNIGDLDDDIDDEDEDDQQRQNKKEERMQLINDISTHLEENSHIFDHQNSHHDRNNTIKDHLNQYKFTPHDHDHDEHDTHTVNTKSMKQSPSKLSNTNINKNSKQQTNDSGSSFEHLFKDNHSASSYDDAQDAPDADNNDDDDEDGLVVLDEQETNSMEPSHRKRNSRSRLSVPRGLSNIDIAAALAADTASSEDNIHPFIPFGASPPINPSESPPMSKTNSSSPQQPPQQPITANGTHSDPHHLGINGQKPLPTPSGAHEYPLALPAIPQTSSVDHIVDAGKTPSDISNKHEKKKSMTQLQLQDLELDKKYNEEYGQTKKRKSQHSTQKSQTSVNKQPLTPLAMMTQIGTEMPDVSEMNADGDDNDNDNDEDEDGDDGDGNEVGLSDSGSNQHTTLSNKTRSSDYKIQQMTEHDQSISPMIMASSVPDPPSLENHDKNSRQITPKAINSEDYIDIFNQAQQFELNKQNETQFRFVQYGNAKSNSIRNGNGRMNGTGNGKKLGMKSRDSITDVNYANNHSLQSGINRADSDYKPLINRDIDEILAETQLYQNDYVDSPINPKRKQQKKLDKNPIMVSPVQTNPSLDNLTYSFDQFGNNMAHKTPVILSDEDDDVKNDNFSEIEETLLIIKYDGQLFINEICDKLANDDEFYINEFKEIHRQKSVATFDSMTTFLEIHSNMNSNIDNNAVSLLFNELLLNDTFSIIPLYRTDAISMLYECITKYQTLKLLDDEASNKINEYNLDSHLDFHSHLKKPTDELHSLDNIHFDDYDEYPSDEVDEMKHKEDIDNNNHHKMNEKIRELFSSSNVYCPKNKNEYNIIKSVLWPHTKLFDPNQHKLKIYQYMESIAIIKPNAVKDSADLIRATLIGNGFIISNIKSANYTAFELESIINGMDSISVYKSKHLRKQEIEYLSSGTLIVMIIKKPIGIDDECLNEQDCFNKLSELIGIVDPDIDRKNDVNTQSIRGCFGENIIKNAIDVTLTRYDFENLFRLFS